MIYQAKYKRDGSYTDHDNTSCLQLTTAGNFENRLSNVSCCYVMILGVIPYPSVTRLKAGSMVAEEFLSSRNIDLLAEKVPSLKVNWLLVQFFQ